MRVLALALIISGVASIAYAELKAGVARASITPLEEGIPTQLGGYGDRQGKPAEGVHDTIYAKALVLDWDGRKTAVLSLDACSVPRCAIEEAAAKAAIDGLAADDMIVAASHTHAGLEGYSLDRRNVADNPNIGLFDEKVLDFVTDRMAKALTEAAKALRPVTAASGVVQAENFSRNRRGNTVIDPDLTVLRLDADGQPYAVLVNFTAHGTIMGPDQMLVSGGWAGNMQRTVEDLFGGTAICLYTNGAEGDIAPVRPAGGSAWEQAEVLGRQVGIAAYRLAQRLTPKPVTRFGFDAEWIDLPEHRVPPNFEKIAGDEYQITEDMLKEMISVMFPARAPMAALRIGDWAMVTIPGEASCRLGMTVKDAVREMDVANPCIAGLANDYVGYILSEDEYRQNSYEVTVSMYGDQLGPVIVEAASDLGRRVAAMK